MAYCLKSLYQKSPHHKSLRLRRVLTVVGLVIGLLVVGTIGSAVLGRQNAYAQDVGPDMRSALSEASELLDLPVEQVQFRGNRKVEDAAIRVNLLTKVGTKLDLNKVREDIRAMWKMGFFSDLSVEAIPSPKGGVIVIFAVKEKPSVRKILVTGNDGLELDKINEVLDLKRDGILNITKIKANRTKIHDLYVEEGYYLASVDYEVTVVNEAEVDVLFVIDEHSKVEIREVSFIGNEKIPDKELRSIIQTSKGGALSFLSDGGVYQEEMFERDLLMITAYYYDRGFINVKIGTPQIRLSRDKKFMYLSIPIDEGPVFEVGTINFKGDMIGDKDAYYNRLTIKPGSKFNRSKVGQDIVRLNDYYKDRGYAYVNVTPLTNVDLDASDRRLELRNRAGQEGLLRAHQHPRQQQDARQGRSPRDEDLRGRALQPDQPRDFQAPRHRTRLLREGRCLHRLAARAMSSSW